MFRWISIIIVLFSLSSRCQSIDETLEWLADQNPDEITSLDQIANDLYFFLNNPIDLNSVDFYKLRQLHLLSDYQIAAIIHYREIHGNFLTIYELGYINLLDKETIRHILPFVTVYRKEREKDTSFAQIARNTNHEIIGRWARKFRNPSPDHAGNLNKFYTRYKLHYRDRFRAGYLVEKDAGEKGADFQSFHAALHSKKWDVIAGDYHVDLGQGLIASTAFRMSGIAASNQTVSFGTKPYTSVGEINYFRGVSVMHRSKNWSYLAFASRRKIDAKLDTTANEVAITSDNSTGLHRTSTELERRKVTPLSHTGFDIERKANNWKVNFHGIHGRYEHPLRLNDREYEQYRFTGTHYSTFGLSHFYQRQHLSQTGEIAMDHNGNMAIVQSLRFQPDAYSKMFIRLWHLPYRFHAPLGVNPDGGSNAQNSRGGSITLKGKLFPKWSMAVYLERTYSRWLKYRIDGPSLDQAEQVYLYWTPDRGLNAYAMFRHRSKTLNDGEKEGVNALKRVNSYNLRFHFDRRTNKRVAVNFRIAISRVRQDSIWTTGWLTYLGASYRTPDRKWDLKARFTIFDTETFESRIYAYEHQARGMFSVPMFNGSGSRFYVMARYKAGRRMSIWLRVSQWLYAWDRASPYPPDRDTEIFGQIVWGF